MQEYCHQLNILHYDVDPKISKVFRTDFKICFIKVLIEDKQ